MVTLIACVVTKCLDKSAFVVFTKQYVAMSRRSGGSRRSVRGFLDQPVPQDVLNKVFDIARWSVQDQHAAWQTFVARCTA